MTKKMRYNGQALYIILTVVSCDYSRLPDLADSGGGVVDAIDDGGVVDVTNRSDGPPTSFGLGLELLAGNIGGVGNVDGTGSEARFYQPNGVAVDGAGNVYVADTINNTVRKVTAAGIVTTIAGAAGVVGSTDGPGADARFFQPTSVAVDSTGNIYVATINNTIRKITFAGVVTTLAGTPGMSGSADGTGAAARFAFPSGVAVDNAGNIYVAELYNSTIRRITATGVVSTLAGTAGMAGSADGTGAAARFNFPSGVAVDGADNVYVADENNHTIRKISPAGVVTTLAGTAGMPGSANGMGAAARFRFPTGVAVDGAGNVYVADLFNYTIRKIAIGGGVSTLAGTAGMRDSVDGTGPAAHFSDPIDLAVDVAGNLYVTEYLGDTIRKITTAGTVTTLAGNARKFGGTDGTSIAARFDFPGGVAVGSAGDVYVADEGAIRKITVAGVVTTLAGTAGTSGSADGTGAAARFDGPSGIAVDSVDNTYVADKGNHTIRKITPSGVVTTLAGTADTSGSADGTGAAARFDSPSGVAVDNVGDIYVADRGNHTIRKVTPSGAVTTLAGSAGMSGSADGTGTAARLDSPDGVAVDSVGNIYVADSGNYTIRKVTATGVVTTLAGSANMSGSTDGMGAVARFGFPTGVAVDRTGNIYIADWGNHTVRRVTPTGTTTTVAGTVGQAGVLLGATPRFGFPQGLAVVNDSIVVADTNAILLLRNGAR